LLSSLLGVPVEIQHGLTLTIDNIRYGEDPNDYYPLVLADVRYENRSQDPQALLVALVCGPTTAAIGGYNEELMQESGDSEVSLRVMRARSFDEGTLTLEDVSFVTHEPDCISKTNWLTVTNEGEYTDLGRWPICGN
jgi:hypothetical protein